MHQIENVPRFTFPDLTLPATWLVRLLNDGGRSRRVDSDRGRAYRALHHGSRIGNPSLRKETP